MIEERKRLEKIRDEFRGFIGTYVHTEYVASTAKDLQAIETRILEDDITSIPDIIQLLELRAQRQVLRAALLSFEDTVATLESRIAQMKRDEEQPNATQQETEETDEPEPEPEP